MCLTTRPKSAVRPPVSMSLTRDWHMLIFPWNGFRFRINVFPINHLPYVWSYPAFFGCATAADVLLSGSIICAVRRSRAHYARSDDNDPGALYALNTLTVAVFRTDPVADVFLLYAVKSGTPPSRMHARSSHTSHHAPPGLLNGYGCGRSCPRSISRSRFVASHRVFNAIPFAWVRRIEPVCSTV